MKKIIIFIVIIALSINKLYSDNEIKIEGVYQGENLFIMNPFAATGVGFCIYEVTVNTQITTDEINSSAFEIDFTPFHLVEGDAVVVLIKHKEGCQPKVLNPEVLKPKSTFTVESIKIDKSGKLIWVTQGEKGALPFVIEQFKWKKWIKTGTVDGKGTPGNNTYSLTVPLHSGINKFRVKQTDYSKKPRYSPEATYRNLAAPVTFTPGNGKKAGNQITFSSETEYEIYDYFGKLRLKGKSKTINITSLEGGSYFINYDNQSETFEK